MARIPSTPPPVPPVPPGEHRPLWSVMIPAYNCAGFLAEALRGVLAQDPGPALMQIEVVDDASTDADLGALVRELGRGRVGYHRQPRNVGSLRNFETCLTRARGRLVHLLHGDDRVRPGFYAKMEGLLQRFPQAGAAFCNYDDINESGAYLRSYVPVLEQAGILKNGLLTVAGQQRIQYVSMVVRREVYETLGSFYGVTYGEDWIMWAQIAKKYQIAYSPEPLAEYRKHKGSISWPKAENGQTTKDLAYVIRHIEEMLPLEGKYVMANAKKGCALYCMAKANVIWKQSKNLTAARDQVKLALSLDRSAKLYYHISKFYLKVALG
ncbi:glycosyltransferase family 2 protein [Rufibacter roseolus]|uniref:glycosyltransferase family 2 protein n=1 Tax=Rufibacter roseolus TaxID=2817375 RepID=UPI001B300CA7|nr:glycosyltransferase [Rufibacter roseolus]